MSAIEYYKCIELGSTIMIIFLRREPMEGLLPLLISRSGEYFPPGTVYEVRSMEYAPLINSLPEASCVLITSPEIQSKPVTDVVAKPEAYTFWGRFEVDGKEYKEVEK